MAGATILWVFDETAGNIEPALGAVLNGGRPGKVILCPVCIDQSITAVLSDRLSADGITSETINFTEVFHRTTFAQRDGFIAFISDFAEENSLRKYFKFSGKKGSKDNSAWWLSLIAEKNPMKSESINKMMKCLAVISLLEGQGGEAEGRAAGGGPSNPHIAFIEIADRQSTAALLRYGAEKGLDIRDAGGAGAGAGGHIGPGMPRPRVLLHFAGAARAIKSTLSRSDMIKRKFGVQAGANRPASLGPDVPGTGVAPDSAPSAARFMMITYFPLLDHDDLGRGKFTNLYYGPLQRALDEEGTPYSWLAMMLSFNGLTLEQQLEIGEKVRQSGHSISFAESWFGVADAIGVSLRFLRLSLRFLIKRRSIASKFRHPSTGLPLWELFSDDWDHSFCGRTLMEGLIYHRIFENALAAVPDGTTVTYMAELHAWEHALNMAARSRGGLKLVGIQHTIVPKMLLNYFYEPRDLAPGREHGLPRPGALACVGGITRQLFLDYGWEESRLFVLGAIRAMHYRDQLADRRAWGDREDKVVIALTISAKEGREVLRFCYQAFRGMAGVKVIVKGHPACPAAPLIASFGHSDAETVFKATDAPLGELLPTAKALIVTESSSTLEGIACQCPVIVPLLPDDVDMNPLTGVSGLPAYVTTPQEMGAAVRAILSADESPIAYDDCVHLTNEYCEFPDSEMDFLRRIKARAN